MNSMQERSVLSMVEANDARKLISMNMDRFVTPGVEASILGYILERTLNYRKFSEWITTKELVSGRPEIGFLGLPFSRRSIPRALKKMHGAKIINITRQDEKHGRYHVVVNVPGLLKCLQPLESIMNASVCKSIKTMIEKIVAYFKLRGWEVGMSYTLDDAKKIAFEQSKTARQRKKEKQDGLKLRVWQIQSRMKEYAIENGEKYSDSWLKPDFGKAKNWLIECENNGKDPDELLYDVAKYWTEILWEVKKYHIFLDPVVSWTQYYKFRKRIEKVLVQYKDEWEEARARRSTIEYTRHSTYEGGD